MNSFVFIDKDAGISSFEVIRRLRKITGLKRIGHCGTLDPFATGLLIVAMGQYTRLLNLVEAQAKSYEATIVLGYKSDTGDREGHLEYVEDFDAESLELSGLKEKVLSIEELRVPRYSAIKIDGKRAYKYAREGEEIEMPLRPMRVYDFEVIGTRGNRLSYKAKVSKGTYIRALSEYIAESSGSCGYTDVLRRTAIAEHRVEQAYSLDNFKDYWQEKVLSAEQVLSFLATYALDELEYKRVINGSPIPSRQAFTAGESVLLSFEGKLVALGLHSEGVLKPSLVFTSGDGR